jgi:hypothetical protein
VTPDAGAATVRRAYLQRLKTCRPERDPTAFMRLRAAYDRLVSAAGRDALVTILRTTTGEATPEVTHSAEVLPWRPRAPEAAARDEVDVVESSVTKFDRAPRAVGVLRAELFARGIEPSAIGSPALFRRAMDRQLDLMIEDALAEAVALHAALEGFIRDPAGRDPPAELAFEWLVLGELTTIARALPPRARVRIAQALRHSDLRGCYDVLLDREVGEVLLRARVCGEAPILGGIHADLVPAVATSSRAHSTDLVAAAAGYFLVAIACAVLAALFGGSAPHRPRVSNQPYLPPIDPRPTSLHPAEDKLFAENASREERAEALQALMARTHIEHCERVAKVGRQDASCGFFRPLGSGSVLFEINLGPIPAPKASQKP